MKKCGDGADGGEVGVNGSVTASSLVKILKTIYAHDHMFVDLGGGNGRVIIRCFPGSQVDKTTKRLVNIYFAQFRDAIYFLLNFLFSHSF